MVPSIQTAAPKASGPAQARGAVGFELAAATALGELRSATAAGIAAAGGSDLNSLALSRKLGIDKSLSWRMVRFAQEGDAFAASKHLPGDAGLRIFVRAIRSAAGQDCADALAAALEGLDRVVREHAGNRTAFRALLANCTEGGLADDRATEFRKSAFQANSALWGIEANARLMLAFLTQGTSGTDVALVSGYLGVRRNRRDLSWPVARRRVLGHQGRTREAIAMPLDPSVPMDAPPMLAEYSSITAESLRPVGTEHGFWYELPEGDIGSAGSVDCVFGERMPGAGPAPKSGVVQPAEVLLRLDMPVEHVLMEIFVDRDIPLAGEPTAALFGLLSGGTGENTADRERQRMPIAERPVQLGNEPKAWSTPVAPRHWEMVHDCMRWLDRRPASFVIHRLALRWPLIPTALVMSTPIGKP